MSKVLKFDASGKPVWAERTESTVPVKAGATEVLSDALGFTHWQYDEMQADRDIHKFNVDFVEDKQVPGFYQVKCSQKEFLRYAKHRGFEDKTSRNGSGGMFTKQHLDEAQQRMRAKYGPPRAINVQHEGQYEAQ